MLRLRSIHVLLALPAALALGCGSGGSSSSPDASTDARPDHHATTDTGTPDARPDHHVVPDAAVDVAQDRQVPVDTGIDTAVDAPADHQAPIDTGIDAPADHQAPADATDGGIPDARPQDAGQSLIAFSGTETNLAPPQVYTMNPDGSGLQAITTATSSEEPTGVNDHPIFSPDGATILFGSGRDFPYYMGNNPTKRMLYKMGVDGSNATRVTKSSPTHCIEHDGRYSHDGKWITFAMACDNVAIPIQSLDQIYRVKADGTGQAALIQPTDASATAWAANQDYPVFSADDSKVIFADDGSGTMQLYTVDLASGAVAQITHLAGSDSVSRAPFVSASTGLVYFTRSGTSDGGTYMAGSLESIHIDGTGEQTVLTIPHAGGDMAAYAMAWSDFALSPDESQLVFWSFVFVSDSGWNYDCTYAITTSTLTGGSLKTLTTATLYDAEYPAWH